MTFFGAKVFLIVIMCMDANAKLRESLENKLWSGMNMFEAVSMKVLLSWIRFWKLDIIYQILWNKTWTKKQKVSLIWFMNFHYQKKK